MFKKYSTVACSGFSFLAFKAYSDLECQGPVVTKAVSQKKLRGGPLWGRLWRVLQTVAEKRDCSLINNSAGLVLPCPATGKPLSLRCYLSVYLFILQ